MSLTDENPLHDSPILHQDIFRIILSFLPIHDLNQIHLSMLSSEKFKSLGMIACQDEFWRNHYDLKIKYLKTITVQTIYVDHSYQKIYPNYVQKYELFTNNFKFHLIEMKHEIDQQAQHRLDQFQKQLQNASDSKNNFKQMTETRKIEQGISVIAKVSCRPHSFYSKKQLQKMCQKLPINQLLKDRIEKDLRFKIMLIGSKGVGKTCLEMAITSNVYRPEYIPTVSEIFQLLYVGNYPIESGVTSYLSIWDSAGGDEYDILRPLSYPDSDLFCLCFNIADLTSIEKLFSKWLSKFEDSLQPFLSFSLVVKLTFDIILKNVKKPNYNIYFNQFHLKVEKH
ncbi:hypothetical protein C9374_004372 [Naegleria lovaniensis]|uniref:Rho family small GTPase n=1 Tax=Naegleria lovaniensis TaxID=51637 RepID=A0AA88GMG9_NAELO|nr:uncharacterized protein C9374_004372 [Naegleria lovaniensis]KAG2383701.1 hypothetical protein C9374_004372 [Naegleria lovaniensis]